MQQRLTSDSLKCQVVVPNIYQRNVILERCKNCSKKGEDYLKTANWKKVHRKLRGHFYIIGKLKVRKSKGVDHLSFNCLRMSIAQPSKANEANTEVLKKTISNHTTSTININRNYEYEQLQFMSETYVSIIEHIFGVSCLISGNVQEAYRIHSKIVDDRRLSFRNQKLIEEAREHLSYELSTIVHHMLFNCMFDNARAFLIDFEQKYGRDVQTRIIYAQYLIMKCETQEAYSAAIKEALGIYEGISAPEDMRAVLLHNRGYLYLLASKFNEADREFKASRKYPQTALQRDVLEYCDWVITKDCKQFERPTALYIRAQALHLLKENEDSVICAYQQFINESESSSPLTKKAQDILARIQADISEGYNLSEVS